MPKRSEPQQHCDHCGHLKKQKQLYRFTFRYTDKKKAYIDSKRGWIHTGYKYVCPTCLKEIIR